MRCRIFLGIMGVWLYVTPAMPLHADGSGWFVSLGAFDAEASTKFRLDAVIAPNVSLGTNLNLEHDLDLPQRRVVPQATLGYRFTDKSSLEFNYFDLRRSGSHVIDKNISYGGVNYAFNTTVSTFSDVRSDSLQYRYTFVDHNPWSLSITAGVHATHFTLGLSDLNTQVSKSVGAQLPLPLLGIRSLYAWRGWQVRADATYFEMTVNNIRGHLNDYTLSLAHSMVDGMSVELGYTYYVLSLQAQRSNLTGSMRFAYQGPFLNLCYGCRTPMADSVAR